MDKFSDTAVLRLQEVLILETQATVTNGPALKIQLAKAFCYSAIKNPFCRCCGTSLWLYLHMSNGPLLLIFCTNRSCCLTLDLPPISAASAQKHPALKERSSQTLPSINIKNMSHRDKATQQLPCVSIPTESFQQAAQIQLLTHTQLGKLIFK